jgi:hypothetical protein
MKGHTPNNATKLRVVQPIAVDSDGNDMCYVVGPIPPDTMMPGAAPSSMMCVWAPQHWQPGTGHAHQPYYTSRSNAQQVLDRMVHLEEISAFGEPDYY